MSKYNTDLDYVILDIDISREELKEIKAEADKIISENKESKENLALAYLKKAQCIRKIGSCKTIGFIFYEETGIVFYEEAGEYIKNEDVKNFLEKALELSQDMPEALMRLGTVYKDDKTDEGHIDTALNLLTKAIQLKPDYAAAFNNRSNIYSSDSKDDIKKAIADLSEAIRIRPSDPNYYYNRAHNYSYLATQMNKKAIEDFSNAINCSSEAFKKNTNIFLERGQKYMELKEYSKAVDDFSESLKLETDRVDTLLMRAKAYYLSYKKDKAKADIEEFLSRKHKLAYDAGREEIFKQISVKLEDI